MYQGSEAVRLDVAERGRLHQRIERPSFEVVEGAGLDARVRSGLPAQTVARLRMAAIAIVALALLGVLRVGILTQTVGILSQNTSMRTELKQARAQQDNLSIEHSVLANGTRIDRIATQSYGMVKATESEDMTAGTTQTRDSASAGVAAAAEGTSEDTDAAAPADESPVSEGSDASKGASAQEKAPAPKLDPAAQTQGDGSTAGANAVVLD